MPRITYDGSLLLLAFERLTGGSAMGPLLALHRALVVRPVGATATTDRNIRLVVASLLVLCAFACGICVCCGFRLLLSFARRYALHRQALPLARRLVQRTRLGNVV